MMTITRINNARSFPSAQTRAALQASAGNILGSPVRLASRAEILDTFTPEMATVMRTQDQRHFEILTVEYVNALSRYIADRMSLMGTSVTSPATILEIAAGRGRLTYFLRKSLELIAPGISHCFATDSGAWGLPAELPVETLDYREALKKYDPQIVLCSWMPPGVDFTAAIRRTRPVNEYILIGQADSDTCGHKTATWGEGCASGKPYENDGFNLYDLEEISRLQFCTFDYSQPFNLMLEVREVREYYLRNFQSFSTTVSFRREG